MKTYLVIYVNDDEVKDSESFISQKKAYKTFCAWCEDSGLSPDNPKNELTGILFKEYEFDDPTIPVEEINQGVLPFLNGKRRRMRVRKV